MTMTKSTVFASFVLSSMALSLACGDDDPAQDDTSSASLSASSGDDDLGSTSGADGPSGTVADSGSTSPDPTESGTGGGCNDVLEGDCGVCLAQECCAEVSACAEVPACLACVGGDPEACADEAAQATTDALSACSSPACDQACGEALPAPQCRPDMESPSGGSCVEIGDTFECNPVTQEPCEVESGAACDVNITLDGFACYPSDNVHASCEPCSIEDGFCQAGFACPGAQTGMGNPGQCSKYCCDDADCGPDGTCYLDFFATLGLPVGYCVPPR
jgi:hypothetical protein